MLNLFLRRRRMASLNNNKWFVVGAAVVGVVSAAVVTILEHYRQEQRRHAMAQDLARLNRQVNGLQGQLESLQKQNEFNRNHQKPKKRIKRSGVLSVTSEDYASPADFDSSDMEFYDLSDEDISRNTTSFTSLTKVLKEIDQNLDSGVITDINKALTLLENLCFEYPECTDLLWRVGKAHYKLSLDIENIPDKLERVKTGVTVCEQSLKLNPDCGETHKWLAILIGVRTEHYSSLKGRLHDGHLFKKHLDIALKFKPDDATVFHLLGQYSLAIASLSWYEKQAIHAFSGSLPNCTIDEAIELLQKAEKIGPKDWKDNKLCLAKCYIALGNYTEGVRWLEDASKAGVNKGEKVDIEINNLLSKYNSYR